MVEGGHTREENPFYFIIQSYKDFSWLCFYLPGNVNPWFINTSASPVQTNKVASECQRKLWWGYNNSSVGKQIKNPK